MTVDQERGPGTRMCLKRGGGEEGKKCEGAEINKSIEGGGGEES